MGVPALLEDWVHGLEADDLGRAITRLSAQINAVNYSLLQLIAEFDRSGGWREQGTMRSCAHWLAANCGIRLGAAREKVRVARQLPALQQISKSFSEGELSYSKVRAVTRVATADNESFLLQLALENSAGHLEKLLSRFEPVPEPGLEGLLDDQQGVPSEGSASGALSSSHDLPLRHGQPAGHYGGSGHCATSCQGDGSGQGGASCHGDGSGQGGASHHGDGSGQGSNSAHGESSCPGGISGDDLALAHQASHQRGPDSEPTLDPEAARELARELYWFQDKDGMWIIHAKLPPEQGQLVMKALQAIARPLEEERREARRAQQQARMQEVARKILKRHQGETAVESQPIESEAAESQHIEPRPVESQHIEPEPVELQAAESQAAGASANGPAMPTPNHLAYTWAEEKISAEMFSKHMDQVRADALVAMVEHFLASGPDYQGLQGLKGAERCQVVMHVDINTLREQRSGVCCTHGRAHFEDKPWLSPSTARRLSCDASLVTVLENDAGKVLNVGRRSRIVPAPIRRALRERDGVCQYPGCQESEYVDAHHIQHWADGGETRLDNLVTLCRFHHRQLHRGCFDIRLNGDSAEVFWSDKQH